MSGAIAALLLFDGAAKLAAIPPVVAGSIELGYPAGLVRPLGVVLTMCVAAYILPRTSVFGALLLTAYLGGAVATHVRVGNPLATHVLFPVYVAAFVWGGLVLRDARLRRVLAAAPRAR